MLRRLTACALVPRAWLTKRAFCIIAAPPRLTAQGRGGLQLQAAHGTKRPFCAIGSAFVCRLQHSKARACAEMPCGAVSRPAGRVADAQRRASAKLPAAEKIGAPCKLFGFPQLFQHPPAPRSRGGQQCPAGMKKELPRKRGSSFLSRAAPTNATPRKWVALEKGAV